MPIAVRDLEGKVVFHIDGEVARDDHGKVVAEPPSLHTLKYQDPLLTLQGAALMRNRAATEEGRQILLDLSPSDVVTPATVKEFGMVADGCIADTLSEPFYIKQDRGVWYIENVTDIVKIALPYGTGAGTNVSEVNPNFTPTTFITVERALCAKIPRQTLGNADFDLRKRTTRFLIEALRTRRELRIANAATTASGWNAANQITVGAGNQWNTGAGSAPLTDLFAALKASLMPAGVLVMPENIAPFFFANGSNQVVEYRQAGGELPQILFARAKFTSGTASSYIWAPYKDTAIPAGGAITNVNIALLRVAQDPDAIQSMRTFRFLGEDNAHDGGRVEGILVRNFKDNREDAEWIVAAYNDADVLLTPSSAPQVGALIVNACT